MKYIVLFILCCGCSNFKSKGRKVASQSEILPTETAILRFNKSKEKLDIAYTRFNKPKLTEVERLKNQTLLRVICKDSNMYEDIEKIGHLSVNHLIEKLKAGIDPLLFRNSLSTQVTSSIQDDNLQLILRIWRNNEDNNDMEILSTAVANFHTQECSYYIVR